MRRTLFGTVLYSALYMAPLLILAQLAVTKFRHNFFVFNAMAAKLCKEQ